MPVYSGRVWDEEQDLAPQLSGGGCGLGTGTEDEINGAVTFLKWFTEPQNNIAFAVESGYLPVTTAANDMDAIRASGLELTDNMEQTLSGAVKTVRENELYTPTAFAGGTAARKILEYSMGDQASADRDTVLARIAAGQSAEAATAEFLTDDYFEAGIRPPLRSYSSTRADRPEKDGKEAGRCLTHGNSASGSAWKTDRKEPCSTIFLPP